jgi:gamma-glutamyltranspeptidase/glutathione hydrolase
MTDTAGRAGGGGRRVAEELVAVLQGMGGVMTAEDLRTHQSTFPDPIMTTYRGVEVWEVPPNGQGLTALIGLNILEGFDLKSMDEVTRMHTMIEAMRLAFADTQYYVTDTDVVPCPTEQLLSKEYATTRRALIDPTAAFGDVTFGTPAATCGTVYFCCADSEGNACSFINSNYMGVGTGIVPKGCGFTLQNRGGNFSLDPTHPNALAPRKRPYHTIIPGLATTPPPAAADGAAAGGESFLRVHWVAVPKASRARRVNRRRRRRRRAPALLRVR